MASPVAVLVIGAGELGLAMLSALHTHPASSLFHVSVMLRPATIAGVTDEKQALLTKVRSLGATPIPGDYVSDSEGLLAHTFSSFALVICCSGFTHGAGGYQIKIARAVLAAGVTRYVPWQFGVDYDVLGAGSSQDLFDEQLQVRALLRGQNKTEWVIVSVGVFMSFLFETWWGVVDREQGAVRALGSWDTKITVTDAADIGVCTVDILAASPKAEGVIFVAGETLSYGQLATNVEKGLGRQMKRELWDMQHLQDELKKDPENGLKKYRPIFASDKGIAWDYETAWNRRRDLPMMSTEGFAARLRAQE